jgi:TyrR family helix-turn-helix protein
MRIEIESTDRLGISQEILEIFSEKSWDIKSVEVFTGFTFVHFQNDALKIDDISLSLENIEGITHCRIIDLLPTESRENHLKALLNRLPDPIIDIDEQGRIIEINQATERLCEGIINTLKGHLLTEFVDLSDHDLLSNKPISLSLSFLDKPYIAEVTPVLANSISSGAVITLKSLDKLGQQLSLVQPQTESSINDIIGQSNKMRMLVDQTLRYAALELPVFISGETGTGKELIARALHYEGHKKTAPFLAVNCAALPEHLLESELFGYSSGAFTGAKKGGKPGLFEMANGGTVFLDEIAEMSIYLQAKLLRFLQDFTFRRIGGTSEIKVNIRVISATHQNISQLLDTQGFREDLFYRLNVLNLTIPPLRERQEDIPLLVKYFISRSSAVVEHKEPHITDEAMNCLQTHQWQGNIRELQNIVFRVVANNESDTISLNDVNVALSQFSRKSKLHTSESNNEGAMNVLGTWEEEQDKFERKILLSLYPQYPTTRHLAERLGVSHNKIAMKLRKYGISHRTS